MGLSSTVTPYRLVKTIIVIGGIPFSPKISMDILLEDLGDLEEGEEREVVWPVRWLLPHHPLLF
jgi:hypothetical protein